MKLCLLEREFYDIIDDGIKLTKKVISFELIRFASMNTRKISNSQRITETTVTVEVTTLASILLKDLFKHSIGDHTQNRTSHLIIEPKQKQEGINA